MTEIPNNPRHCGSWVVVRKSDGVAVLETFRRDVAEAIDQGRYDVVTTLDWLVAINQAAAMEGA